MTKDRQKKAQLKSENKNWNDKKIGSLFLKKLVGYSDWRDFCSVKCLLGSTAKWLKVDPNSLREKFESPAEGYYKVGSKKSALGVWKR